MKNAIRTKVKSHLIKIKELYFKLIRLELDNFRLIILCEGFSIEELSNIHLTTSGSDQKITERRKLMYETFYSQKQDIVDSFFLTLAKLFDESKRNKPISVPTLVTFLSNNIHLFDEKTKVQKMIKEYQEKLIEVEDILNIIKEHRDQCLAHNDPKKNCGHLENLTTNETRKIMDVIFNIVNEVSELFDVSKIDKSEIERIRSESFNKNYRLLEKFEQ